LHTRTVCAEHRLCRNECRTFFATSGFAAGFLSFSSSSSEDSSSDELSSFLASFFGSSFFGSSFFGSSFFDSSFFGSSFFGSSLAVMNENDYHINMHNKTRDGSFHSFYVTFSNEILTIKLTND